jgi:mevalonate kinase
VKKIGYGHGYGKVILFGEHFVVHGYPALVMSLPQKTLAEVCLLKTDDRVLIDNRPKVPTFNPTKTKEYEQMVKNICKYLGVDAGLQITLSGDLTVTSGGIGASAAACVAISRAINDLFELNLSDDVLLQAALEGERAIHGNPSGVDTTAAMLGGVFVFKRECGPLNPAHGECKQRERIEPSPEWRRDLHLMLIDSGIPANTKEAVAAVAQKLKDKPQEVKQIFDSYAEIFAQALSSIKDNDFELFINLLNKNHDLLCALGVSCPEIEEIREFAFNAGAVAIKITGTGRGGLVLVVTDNLVVQNKLANEVQKVGLAVFKIY